MRLSKVITVYVLPGRGDKVWLSKPIALYKHIHKSKQCEASQEVSLQRTSTQLTSSCSGTPNTKHCYRLCELSNS